MMSPIMVPKDLKMSTKKMKKLTVKQQIKLLTESRDEYIGLHAKVIVQLQEQNQLLERALREGNLLIERYNKLAGKINSIRTLVTSDD